MPSPDAFCPAGGAFLVEDADPATLFVPEDFTPDDRLLAQAAEDFLQQDVMPHVERIEEGDHALMHELMQKAGALGLLGADVPEAYGGLGLPVPVAALLAEKLNPQQSFALSHEAHTVIATLPLLYFGNHEQKARYLPKLASGEWIGSFALSEPGSGSDALSATTKATLSPDGAHWMLNGTKQWITNSAFASLFTVFAQVDGKFTAFLVERGFPGVSFGPEEKKLGMRGTSTRRVLLDNVPVPLENALEVGRGQYAAFCALNLGRFKLEAGAVGGIKYILALCAAYAGQRKAFGKTLGDFGLVQHKLAEMAARTFGLESMVYRLAGLLEGAFGPIAADAPDASARYFRAAEEYAIECNVVKVLGSEAYSQLADEAIQMHGGYGYSEKFPLARAWRDQRLLRIGEGANEIVRLAIVNLFLRRAKQGRLTLNQSADSEGFKPLASDTQAGAPAENDAQTVKTLALLLLNSAARELGDGLLDAQEITAAIADVVCSAYALESSALRLQKRAALGLNNAVAERLAQVAALGYGKTAEDAALYALHSLPALDTEPARALLARLAGAPANPMQSRRALAADVLHAGGYPL